MSRIKLLNVEIDNITQKGLLESLKQGVLVTPNVDQIGVCVTRKYCIYALSYWGHLCLKRYQVVAFSLHSMNIIRKTIITGFSSLVQWKVWHRRQWRILTKKLADL